MRFALGIALFVALVRLPHFVAGSALDPSWQAGLGEFYRRGAQAGVDYIFTYGPLGYFESEAFVAELFWQRYAWEIGLKAVCAAVVVLLAGSMRPAIAGHTFLVAAICLLPNLHGDAPRFVVLACGLLFLRDSRWQLPGLALTAVLFAVLALTKFTYFPLAVAVLVVLGVLRASEGRYAVALAPLGLFAGFFMIAWTLAGQRLANLPAFFRGMSEIVGGYPEAMAQSGPPNDVRFAVAVMLLVLAAAATFGLKDLLRPPCCAGMAILALGLTVNWKHGFIRYGLHGLFFFHFTLLLPWLVSLLIVSERRQKLRHALFGLAWVLSAIAFYTMTGDDPSLRPTPTALASRFKSHVEQIFRPALLYASLVERRSQLARQEELPRIKSRVERDTIDLFSCQQGILFLNDLNWTPRPVFQSYSAYTAPLLAANAKMFRDAASAPRYVLWKPAAIDKRFPTMEDSAATFEIIDHYRPVLFERSWLLLERAAPTARSRPLGHVTLRRSIAWGETLRLDPATGKYETISLEIGYSTWGRLRAVAYRPDRVWVQVVTAKHGQREFRIIPGMAREEFLLNPLCEDAADLVDVYRDQPAKRIVSLTFHAKGHEASFRPAIEVTLRAYPRLSGESWNETEFLGEPVANEGVEAR